MGGKSALVLIFETIDGLIDRLPVKPETVALIIKMSGFRTIAAILLFCISHRSAALHASGFLYFEFSQLFPTFRTGSHPAGYPEEREDFLPEQCTYFCQKFIFFDTHLVKFTDPFS